MDRIRTLVLARTHTVVLDPDLVASAATRPLRDADVDRFEAELARMGFVMSLDLAMTTRRLPSSALHELRDWVVSTLAAHHPRPPAAQICPWCGKPGAVGALEPCRHLACRACWEGSAFAACPICHRRVTWHGAHAGALAVLHLGIDVVGAARGWLERLLARTTPLTADERGELEAVIDALGPDAASWLPSRILVPSTMAIAVARLWLVAADRTRMAAQTAPHVASATDVLRVAAILLGAGMELAAPRRLHSVPRDLRRAILETLERVPHDPDAILRHRALWQRVGEQVHAREHAARLPNAARVFELARSRARHHRWAGAIEEALARGDVLATLARMAERPVELVRRMRHVERLARACSPDAVARLDALCGELLRRAARERLFPRAVIDRALGPGAWEAAALHASARANLVYVRERDGTFTIYRRRDGEQPLDRLRRLLGGTADSYRLVAVPTAEAPTFAVLANQDLPLPAGSAQPQLDELLAALTS
jgi:hypothetical protein